MALGTMSLRKAIAPAIVSAGAPSLPEECSTSNRNVDLRRIEPQEAIPRAARNQIAPRGVGLAENCNPAGADARLAAVLGGSRKTGGCYDTGCSSTFNHRPWRCRNRLAHARSAGERRRAPPWSRGTSNASFGDAHFIPSSLARGPSLCVWFWLSLRLWASLRSWLAWLRVARRRGRRRILRRLLRCWLLPPPPWLLVVPPLRSVRHAIMVRHVFLRTRL